MRAQQAVQAVLDKHLRYWGPRYQVEPIEIAVEGNWAHAVAKWRSQARTFKETIHILAHRLPDGTWQALMPETEGLYLLWLDAISERVVPGNEKSQLRAQANRSWYLATTSDCTRYSTECKLTWQGRFSQSR